VNDGYTLLKKLVAEGTGTAFLLAAVVGSGIMAERLSAGNVSLALLENTVATGAALVALILAFGPISGAHFQSCGDGRGCNSRWSVLEVCAWLRLGSMYWRTAWGLRGPPDVRAKCISSFRTHAQRWLATVQ